MLDRYLAKVAYDGQQYDGQEDPARPSNLWEPVPGDFGPHGGFGDRSRDSSWEMFFVRNRYRLIALVAAGVVAAYLLGWKQMVAWFG